MEIAQYAATDYTVPGGLQSHVLFLSRELQRSGHNVTIVAGKPPGTEGLRFITPEEFKPADFSVVHSHGGFGPGPAASLRIKTGKAKHVFTYHGTVIGNLAACSSLRLLMSPRDAMFRSFLSRELCGAISADNVICVSNCTSAECRKYYFLGERRITVIPNGGHRRECTEEELKQLRYSLGITDKNFVFLFVGRIDSFVKGGQLMLEAFKRVFRDNPQCRLLCVPPCGTQEHPGVIFAKPCAPDAMPAVYRIAHALVNTSLYEGCSVAAIEAVLNGLPVILTENGSNMEIIRNTSGGVLAKPDAASVACAMLSFLKDPGLLEKYRNAPDERKREYGWQAIAEKTLAVYGQ